MCDYSAKLIPWLDRELGEADMADVQRHMHECIECRSQLSNFEQMSKRFDAYCDAVIAVKSHQKRPFWLPVLSATAAAAIAVALMLFILHTRLAPAALPPAVVAATPPAITLEKTPNPRKPLPRRHAPTPPHAQPADWQPAIQIAIPAESMFPPGAIPEGFTFTADVSLAPDGSPEQLGLRPRLIGFERSITQP
jgi:hypothetical protein